MIVALRKAADQGDAEAQYQLGNCYYDGDGVAKNYAEGVKWYRQAAEQGLASAQFKLGLCYKAGNGVAEDPAEAVKWFNRAAEQGFARAKFHLGHCYRYGEGVARDEAKAEAYLREATEQGYSPVHYADNIQGVLFDKQKHPFIVFIRTSTGPFKFLHVLAQNSSGEVFIIQETKTTSDMQLNITLQNQKGTFLQLVPMGIRELEEEAVVRCLAAGAARTKAFRRDTLSPKYWSPLEKGIFYDFIDRLSKFGRNMPC